MLTKPIIKPKEAEFVAPPKREDDCSEFIASINCSIQTLESDALYERLCNWGDRVLLPLYPQETLWRIIDPVADSKTRWKRMRHLLPVAALKSLEKRLKEEAEK